MTARACLGLRIALGALVVLGWIALFGSVTFGLLEGVLDEQYGFLIAVTALVGVWRAVSLALAARLQRDFARREAGAAP